MKKYIFLTIISILLLFILTCDLYDKSIPEYLDTYTNTAAIVDHAFTGGILVNPQGNAYPGLIKSDSVIDLKLRNPKSYELSTYLDYYKDGEWVPFVREELGDYSNVVNISDDPYFYGTVITVKYNPTNHIRITIAEAEIAKSYKLRIRLFNKLTNRWFEPYVLPLLTCTDSPKEVKNLSVASGSGGNGLRVKWEQELHGNKADANYLVIRCPSLGLTETYTRSLDGTTLGEEWQLVSGTSTITRTVLGGDAYSAIIGGSMLLTEGAIYNVVLYFANSAGVEMEVSQSMTGNPFCATVTIGGTTTSHTTLGAAFASITSTGLVTIVNDIDEIHDEGLPQTPITISGSKTITIVSGDGSNTIQLGASHTGGLFIVDNGSTLNIGSVSGSSLILRGKTGNNAALVTVNTGGTVTLDTTARIENNQNSGNGGGVYSAGTLNMNGGSIAGNSANNGGGVYVAAGGTFNMSAGARVTPSGNNIAGANDVYLVTNRTINIANNFSGTGIGDVARITLQSYAVGTQVLAGNGTLISDNYTRFALVQPAWCIGSAGQLQQIITNVAITVTPPVAAGTPNTTAAGTGNFTIDPVLWTPPGNFVANTTYTATVTLTVASSGYTFAGMLGANATINAQASTIEDNTGNTITLSRTFTANKLDPVVTWPTNLTAAFGQTLADVSLPGNGTSTPAGTFTWTAPDTTSVGNVVGTHPHNLTFTPNAGDIANYNVLTQNVNIVVSQSPSTVTTPPTASTITYGATLSASNLSGGAGSVPGTFAWTTPTDVPTVSNSGYQVTFTPSSTNYSTSTVNVPITVNKANININNITPLTKTYDGTASATPGTVSFAGLVNGETLAVGTDYTVGAVFTGGNYDAGTGNKPYTYTITMTSNLKTDNYNLTTPTSNGTNGTINTKALTITGVMTGTREYDQTTSVALAGGSLVGVVAGDTVGFTLGSGTMADASAGPGKNVSTNITLTGAQAGNYTLTQPIINVTITQKPITITGVTATNREYDRTTNVALTGGALQGVLAGDTVNFTLGNGTIADANVGGKNVNTTIALTGTHAGNYSLTQPTGITVTISQKPITITGVTATSRQYDGTTSVTLANGTLQGVVAGDTVGFTLNGGTIADANYQATAKAVTVNNITLTGTPANNYSLTQPTGITVLITQRALTLTINSINRTTLTPMDGETFASITFSVTGLVTGDTATISCTNLLAGTTFPNITTTSGTFTYNGTTAVPIPGTTFTFSVSGGTNYTAGTRQQSITIYDGQVDYPGTGNDRRIPVDNTNFTAFGTYARSANGLTKHYKLTGNVTATGTWTAIGTEANPFSGSFDGNGYTISNLTINTTTNNQGFFGVIVFPEPITISVIAIRNVALLNCNISGGENVGGLLGFVTNAIVEKCYVTGTVRGTSYVGGIAGGLGYSILRNSYSTASVTGDTDVGGLMGGAAFGMAFNCYATGSVTATSGGGGGLSGGGYFGAPTNCVALNGSITVTGTGIGRVSGTTGVVPQNCYARATGMTLTRNGSPYTPTPALNGSDGENTTLYNTQAFYTTASNWREVQDELFNSYVWDFTTVWQMGSNNLPILRGVGGAQNHTLP